MAKNTKKAQAQATKNTQAISKAANLNIDTSLTAITAASLKVQGDFSKISEQLIQKHAELQAVDEAIALKKQEMEALHGVDQVLLTIDEARALHTEQVAKMEEQRNELQKQYNDLRATLEQQRAREQDDYKYKLDQTRKADADAWAEQIRVRGIQERDRIETFEKSIATREAELKKKEVDYQAALSKAATFDDEVKKVVATEVAKVTGALTKDFKHQQEIASIQHATQVEKLRFDNERLVGAAASYEAQVKELQAQLKEAYAKNTELAAKAVEAASNKEAQANALSLLTNIGGGNGTSRPRT